MHNWRADVGPLNALITERLRDLCIDGNGRVWTDSGAGFESTGLHLEPTVVRRIGVTVIENGGGRVDDARPIGDAALAGEVRAHLVLPPVARAGPLLSLRFPSRQRVTLDDFAADGSTLARMTHETALIGGLTGSGKTTLASAIIDALPAPHRVVIVEDIAELSPSHQHTVHLTTRPPNVDGGGRIELADIVRESLRMRPDSLVVGEIRGAEIREFLAAVTAGHHGLSTIHARGLDEIGVRVMTLAMLAGIPRDAIAPLVVSAIPLVAVCRRVGAGVSVTTGRFVEAGGELRVERD